MPIGCPEEIKTPVSFLAKPPNAIEEIKYRASETIMEIYVWTMKESRPYWCPITSSSLQPQI